MGFLSHTHPPRRAPDPKCPTCRGTGRADWAFLGIDPCHCTESKDTTIRKPKLLILGHARHGKDTVAEILRDEHGFSFASSSLFAAEKCVRPALAACGIDYPSLEACYADRVNHRAFWYAAISTYNRGSTSRLAEAILKDHDCYVGMRSDREFRASCHLFDHVLWVDAYGRDIPLEPPSSFDIEYDESMVLVDNNGTLPDLHRAVAAVVKQIMP